MKNEEKKTKEESYSRIKELVWCVENTIILWTLDDWKHVVHTCVFHLVWLAFSDTTNKHFEFLLLHKKEFHCNHFPFDKCHKNGTMIYLYFSFCLITHFWEFTHIQFIRISVNFTKDSNKFHNLINNWTLNYDKGQGTIRNENNY